MNPTHVISKKAPTAYVQPFFETDDLPQQIFEMIKAHENSPHVLNAIQGSPLEWIIHNSEFYPPEIRLKLAYLLANENQELLFKTLPRLQIETSEQRLELFLYCFNSDTLNTRKQGNWFTFIYAFHLEPQHQLAAIKHLLELNQNLKEEQYLASLVRWRFSDSSYNIPLAVLLYLHDPWSSFQFISRNSLQSSHAEDLQEALSEFQILMTSFSRLETEPTETLFSEVLNRIKTEMGHFCLAQLWCSTNKSLMCIIHHFDKLQITSKPLIIRIVESILTKNLPSETVSSFCKQLKVFKLPPNIHSEIMRRVLESYPLIVVNQIQYLNLAKDDEYCLAIVLITSFLEDFLKHFDSFKMPDAKRNIMLGYSAASAAFKIGNPQIPLELASKFENIPLPSDKKSQLIQQFRFIYLCLLMNNKTELLFTKVDMIKELSENKQVEIFHRFLISASPSFITEFIERLSFFQPDKDKRFELSLMLIPCFKPQELVSYFKLLKFSDDEERASFLQRLLKMNPVACLQAIHIFRLTSDEILYIAKNALEYNPEILFQKFKNNKIRISNKTQQYEFAKAIVEGKHYSKGDFFVGNTRYSYFQFLLFLDHLSEKELLELVSKIICECHKNDNLNLARIFNNDYFEPLIMSPNLIADTLSMIKANFPSSLCIFFYTLFDKLYACVDDITEPLSRINSNLSDAEKILLITDWIGRKDVLWLFIRSITFINRSEYVKLLDFLFREHLQAFLLYFKDLKISDLTIRAMFALKLARIDPPQLIFWLDSFEIQSPEVLREIGFSIYRNNRKLVSLHLDKFGFASLDELDRIEIDNFNTLSSDELETELQKKYFEINQPELLELIGNEMFRRGKKASSAQDYEVHWGARFLEKAARMYQQQWILNPKIISLRLELAKHNLICSSNPLFRWNELLNEPFTLEGGNGLINFGTPFQFMGSANLKGGCFHIKRKTYNNCNILEVTFKLLYWAAEHVRENIKLLNVKVMQDEVIAQGFCRSISIKEVDYSYFPDPSRSQTTFTAGKALKIDFEGLGIVEIGNTPEWGSMINFIRILLPEHACQQDLQKIFACIGLADAVTMATDQDIKRIITNKMIHFYTPFIAATQDDKPEYHEIPLKSLLAKLNDKQRKVINLNSRIYYSTFPICGDIGFKVNRLSDRAEILGGRGFFACCAGPVQQVAQRMGSLFKAGLLSTQTRFNLGWTNTSGISPDADFQENSADGAFLRLLTTDALSKNLLSSKVKGPIQFFVRLEAIKMMPYFYMYDNYGSRLRGRNYQKRPDYIKFISEQNTRWNPNNEVIFKRVPAKYLCAITYQDERKRIVNEIEKLVHGHLFSHCNSMEEKAKKVSELYFSKNKQLILDALKSPRFDSIKETFVDNQEGYEKFELTLANHWLLDPKPIIIESLAKAGVDHTKLLIQEQDNITQEILNTCYTPLLKKVKRLALKPHLTLKEQNLRDDYHILIETIKQHLHTLSDNILSSYLTKASIKQINQLNKACQKYISSLDYNGQDSLNRELLTQPWNHALYDSNVIVALFALEELYLRQKEEIERTRIQDYKDARSTGTKEHIIDEMQKHRQRCHTNFPLLFYKVLKNKDQYLERTLTDCLYFGLKDQHPVILLKLPTNKYYGEVVSYSSNHHNIRYLREYLRQSKGSSVTRVFHAIEMAYEFLLHHKPLPCTPTSSLFNQPYDSALWKTRYADLLNKIIEKIDATEEEALLKLIANQYTNKQLKEQCFHGFNTMMQNANVKPENIHVNEIIKTITYGDYLLDQKISHFFCDRIHLTAALKSSSSYPIKYRGGFLSLRTLMLKIMKSFQRGVNEDNAIAAEQFYLRIIQIYERLSQI